MIYAIRAGHEGPIKFGVSNDVEGRMATLQTGNSEQLLLIAYCAVHKQNEATIHHFLREDRLEGEWFKPTPKVLGMVKAMHRQACAGPYEHSIIDHIYEHGFDTIVWFRQNNLGFEVFEDEVEMAVNLGITPRLIRAGSINAPQISGESG